jgi:hypothetical protein
MVSKPEPIKVEVKETTTTVIRTVVSDKWIFLERRASERTEARNPEPERKTPG